ncbi:MAG: hypothetical protein AABZ36_01860 [Nitrospirota bacterium]
MFKLIFKTILAGVILIAIIIALAVWKGGAPFKWAGEKTVEIGKSIRKFGDFIDGIKEKKEKAGKALDKIKDAVDSTKD